MQLVKSSRNYSFWETGSRTNLSSSSLSSAVQPVSILYLLLTHPDLCFTFYFPSNLLHISFSLICMLSPAHIFWIQNVTSDPVSEKPELHQLHSKKKPHRACYLCKRQHHCQNLFCSWAPAFEPTMPNQSHILWRASIVPEQPQYLAMSKLIETDLTHLLYRAIPRSQQSRTVSHHCSILHANGNSWPLCCVLRWKKINQLCHTSLHVCYEVRLCT